MTHDATIVWSPMNYTEDEKCKVKKIHDGNGIKTKLADNTFKLIDETNQLEFHFQNETFSICNHQFHKLLNIAESNERGEQLFLLVFAPASAVSELLCV